MESKISFCAICDGAHYFNRDVIVVGGGNAAVEEAIYLAGLAKTVRVVTLFALTADPVSCDRLRKLDNIKIYEYYDILKFFPDAKFSGLRAKSTEIGEEIIFKANGQMDTLSILKPAAEVFTPLGILNEAGYIKTNAAMEIKILGVFAARDITDITLQQVITACGDGAVASQAAIKFVREKFVKPKEIKIL